MKKIIFMLFSLGLLVTLVACATTNKPSSTTTGSTTGSTTATTTEPVAVDDLKPVFYGLFNTVLTVGDTFDPMAGVTAVDNVDGDITSRITYTLPDNWDLSVAKTYVVTYTVTDDAGNTKTQGRSIKVNLPTVAGRILNPNFDTELAPWGHWAGDGGAGTSSWEDGYAKIEITGIGTANYHVQFEQKELTIEGGKFYQVSFKAKALEARSIGVLVEDPAAGYRKYGSTIHNITTEWATYTLDVAVDTATINTAKLGFMLGKVDDNSKETTVFIDDVTMVEVTPAADEAAPTFEGVNDITIELNSTFDPKAGVVVKDNQDFSLTMDDVTIVNNVDVTQAGEYTVTYTVTDASGNEGTATRTVKVVALLFKDTNEVANGNFTTDETVTMDHEAEGNTWREWHQNYDEVVDNHAQVTFAIVDGELVSTITKLGAAGQNWTIQLQQTGISLEKGKTYKLVFDAKASVARDIKAVLKTATDKVYSSKVVTLSDTMATYEFIFTVTGKTEGNEQNQETDHNMNLSFEMGTFGSTTPQASVVTYDNIKLLVLDEPTLVKNGDFANAGWGVFSASNDAAFTFVNGEGKYTVTTVGGDNWSNQLELNNLVIENGKHYRVSFKAWSTVARPLELVIEDPAKGYYNYGRTKLDLGTTRPETSYTLEFDSAQATSTGKLGFMLGNVTDDSLTTTSVATDIFFDDVVIEVLDGDAYTNTGLIINPNFDSIAVDWTVNQNNTDSPAKTVDSAAEVVVTDVGTVNWSNQLFQQGITLKGGRTYVIEFKASALDARPMEVKVEDPNAGYFTYKSEVVQLTTDVQTFTITFTVETGTTTAKLGFHLGPVDGTTVTTTVQIDDVVLYPTFNPAE